MKRCLYGGTLSLPEEVKSLLKNHQVELVENPFHRALTEKDLLSIIDGFDAVLAGPEPYTKEVMDKATNLKVISRTGVGYDNIDVGAASQKGIFVTWAPIPELANSIAEQTFGLLLTFVKRIPFLNQAIRQGKWERTKWSEDILDIYSMTLGLLGLGRIGVEVAKRGLCFGMKLVYYDMIRRPDLEQSLGLKYVSLDELLSSSDVLSIHVPLTAQTDKIINEETISKMKKDAIIINTARGAVIDELALEKALSERRLGGALLDVLSEEPPGEKHVFYKLGDRIPNLIITPHIGLGRSTVKELVLTAARDSVRVLEGEAPMYSLNKDKIKTA